MADTEPHPPPPPAAAAEEEDQQEGCYLSNHCVAMRKALRHCLEKTRENETLFRNVPSKDKLAERCGAGERAIRLQEAQRAARSVPQDRTEKLEAFRASDSHNNIAVLEDLSRVSPLDFRRTYEHANLPTKIARLPSDYFDRVKRDLISAGNGTTSEWRNVINRSWFLERLGPESMVPVRIEPSTVGPDEPHPSQSGPSDPPSGLDEDGRATECETKLMTVRQWIDLLDDASNGCHGEESTGSLYLKDWHFLSLLNRQRRSTAAAPSTACGDGAAAEKGRGTEVAGWYRVPLHFGHDVLNHFLTTFFVDDDGSYNSDYYFCYWGPAGSRTARHSDVLNSFSWSYNVCGHKTWTFYPPPSPSDPAEPDPGENAVVLHQEAGECVFVPSGWQHSVTNCEEALSLNHNWITTANVDLVWECLRQEMDAIERELVSWHAPATHFSNPLRSYDPPQTESNDDSWDARESMLRGCVGLDVTAFYLMVTFSITDLLCRAPAPHCDIDDEWEFVFDATRLRDSLQTIKMQLGSIHLARRLQAGLSSQALAREALSVGRTVIEQIDTRLEEILR